MSRIRSAAAAITLLVFILGFSSVGAAASWTEKITNWDLRAGYGYQYTNSTRPNHFQVVEVLPSFRMPLSGSMGPDWFRGKFVWNPELNLALFTNPYVRPMIGITPLQFQWAWDTHCRFKPYVFAGAGILYANINRRETRKDLNFNLQPGIGFYYELNADTSLIAEYRHVHVSNAGLHEDNAGMNTHNFLVGVSVKK